MWSKAWVLTAVAGGLAGLGYFAAPGTARWWLWPVFPLGAAVITVVALRLQRPVHTGPSWILVAALATIGVGDVIRVLGGAVDLSSLCFLLGYLLLATSARRFARLRLPEGDRTGAIDATIVMVAIAAVLWDTIAAPAMTDARTRSEVVSLIGFPVLQAWVMASVARIMFTGARLFAAWALVLASAATLAANVLMITAGGELTNPSSQVLWAFTYVAVATGMSHPSFARLAEPAEDQQVGASYARLCVLGLALAAVPAVMLRNWNLQVQGPPISILASIVCVVLVLWRLGLLLAEREGSLRQLRSSWTELERRAQRESALARMSEGAVGPWTLEELVDQTREAVTSVIDGAAVEVHLGDRPPAADPTVRRFPAATVDRTYGWIELGLEAGADIDDREVAFTRAAANVLASAVHRRLSEAEAEHRSLHDGLTGLPNRTLFMDRLGHALARRDRPSRSLAVLFVDLDGFKSLNDSLGHLAGDSALVEVARRIEGCVRASDTVARLAGDEFVVACEEVAVGEAVALGERIVAAIGEPFVLPEHGRASLGASVGIAVDDQHPSAQSLLHEADAAMYESKRAGGSRVVLAVALGRQPEGPTPARAG